MYFTGFIKYDLENEKVVKSVPFGNTKTAGEVFFHKKENAQSEDDGYLMTFVYDWDSDQSELVMWDAKTMEEKPVLRAKMKTRVPHGFHSYFVTEDELEE